jgi:argininosuccinate lyase
MKLKGKGRSPASKRPGASSSQRGAPKMWSGRFREKTHPDVETFTASLASDFRLADYDVQGSLAHCRALGRAGILSKGEVATLVEGLERVRAEFADGRFPVRSEDEDIHMAVERRLTELIGPLGGKLHTGRSRNDQVTLDTRLYLRDALRKLDGEIHRFQRVLLEKAEVYLDVVMPGYTHLQRAQPVLFAHHLLAYLEMLSRDRARLSDARKRLDVMPLGSGALAGTNFAIDRDYLAKLLGFANISQNSLDAVSDRDFALETVAGLAILMMHLSRLSEELILWASQEFQFVELPDGFCTGSSMMPQKKNPDVPELVRGKTGRVYGDLITLLTVLKGLPLSYNRDLQEDKPPLFDALDTVDASIKVLTGLMEGLTVNRGVVARAAESWYMLATELADYLVTRGVPFREAHATAGRAIRYCLDQQKDLRRLTLEELRSLSEHFEKDTLDILKVEGAIERKGQVGGTARKQVERRIRALKKLLN